ncbi:hypothetical protein [uncultured Kriegella sp.]|uniref:hypothetical protein n=1 Tax=uncultured Kriegella sp. TaxID=1798910 RepID=UPI0030D8243E|tara:strand:- start:123515 stop:123781 length:267 start_codon:yes stop_codon:yes gene_type:complete
MKYKIVVEGGFTGITRKYEGEISVSELETSTLIDAMGHGDDSQLNIPDGQAYQVFLQEDAQKYQAVFNEKSMPEAIRRLMAKVKQKKQ